MTTKHFAVKDLQSHPSHCVDDKAFLFCLNHPNQKLAHSMLRVQEPTYAVWAPLYEWNYLFGFGYCFFLGMLVTYCFITRSMGANLLVYYHHHQFYAMSSSTGRGYRLPKAGLFENDGKPVVIDRLVVYAFTQGK